MIPHEISCLSPRCSTSPLLDNAAWMAADGCGFLLPNWEPRMKFLASWKFNPGYHDPQKMNQPMKDLSLSLNSAFPMNKKGLERRRRSRRRRRRRRRKCHKVPHKSVQFLCACAFFSKLGTKKAFQWKEESTAQAGAGKHSSSAAVSKGQKVCFSSTYPRESSPRGSSRRGLRISREVAL